MALWLLGLATIHARHHYQYQANTTRDRLVLSAITLGRHVIQRGRDRLPASVLWAALRHSQVTLCALTTPWKFVGSPQGQTPLIILKVLTRMLDPVRTQAEITHSKVRSPF
jgi:hypothetical protein